MAEVSLGELVLLNRFRDELKEFGLKQAVERLDVPERGIVRQRVRQLIKEWLHAQAFGGEMKT